MPDIKCDTGKIVQLLDNPAIPTQKEIEAHLDSCEHCQTFLNQHVASEAEWHRAQNLLQPGEFDVAKTADFSAAGALERHHGPNVQDVLDFLTPTDDPHRLGRIGSYEVSGVVGIGGMGVVLKAIEPALDRVVAIKVMSPNLSGSEKARLRFAREARAAAAVLHPNVIPIYSVSNEDKLSYLVMAYIPGGSLQKRIDQQGPFPVEEILRIGVQIAGGLEASHKHGLVHRDIKPENILLEGGVERITITDFGLARAVDDNSLTQVGTIAGTPMYMSPEQARGEQVDHFSDLFSLGSVLYALCTGEPPFRADTSYSVMRKIIDESPTPIRELNSDIPEWLESIVEKLMAREKADRFGSADEVHKLLERCLSHVKQPDTVPLPKKVAAISPSNNHRTQLRKLAFASVSIATLLAISFLATNAFWPQKPTPLAENNKKTSSQPKNESGPSSDVPRGSSSSSSSSDEQELEQAKKELGLADLTHSDLAWIMEQMVGAKSEIPDDKMPPHESLVRGVNQFMDLQPSSRGRLARLAVEAGRPEIAKVLLTEDRVAPAAGEAMKLAGLLIDSGKVQKAIDAYLDAFRAEPRLFQDEHLQFIEKEGRLDELAEVFTVDRLRKTRGITIMYSLLDSLMTDELCADYGIPFLERLWDARPDVRDFLGNISQQVKRKQSMIICARWVPNDIAKDSAGWNHLCRVGTDGGWQNWLAPSVEKAENLQTLKQQVSEKLKENENWYAGKALIGILEAKTGNFEPAKKWIEANLDRVTSKPKPNSDQISPRHAKIIGEYLKDKDETLDQWVKKLQEKASQND